MATYGLYLKLDVKVWQFGDYSDDHLITGTLYSDSDLENEFSLTGFTGVLRFMYPNKAGENLNIAITQAADQSANKGEFTAAFSSDNQISKGLYWVKAEITKTGSVLSSLNIVEFLVKRGTSA